MVSSQIKRLRFIRWSAVCGETRMHGAERGKRRRQHQTLTYRYQKVATIRKYEISVTIIIQSLAQMQKMYEKDWQGIAGNCDTTIYLGGGTDTDTTKWVSELLGKETRVISGTNLGKSGSTSLNRQAIELFSPAELRTMPEDECVVIMKSMPPYKGKKYWPPDHPERVLVTSLDPYYFNEEKKNKIYQMNRPLMAEEDDGEAPEEEHGGDPVKDEPEEAVFKEENEEKKQEAAEYNNNRDAENKPIIEEPVRVNENSHEFVSVVSANDSGGKPQIQEREKSMSTSDEAWGLDELEFGTASMDDSPY